MPAIFPVSDLKNYYSGIVNSVSYGNRVYLTKNGVGKCALVDMRELEDLDKQKALLKLMTKLTDARSSVSETGTVSAEILEKELGMECNFELEYECSNTVSDKLHAIARRYIAGHGDESEPIYNWKIIRAARRLADNPNVGIPLSDLYDINIGFRYCYAGLGYYLFYYVDGDKLIIAELFNARDDELIKLWEITTPVQKLIDSAEE